VSACTHNEGCPSGLIANTAERCGDSDVSKNYLDRRKFIRLALLSSALPHSLCGTLKGEEEQPTQAVEPIFTFTLSKDLKQQITGWGCFPGWVAWGERIATDKSLQDAIYRDLGISVARVPIMPEYGNPDGSLNIDAIDKSLAKQIRTMRDYGITKWIVTTWSPPTYMKTLATSKGNQDGRPNRLKPEFEDAFVKYYVQVLVHLRDTQNLGAPIYATIQNEPDYAAEWDGCVYDPEQWRRVTKRLRKTLDDANLTSVKVHGTDHNHYTLREFFGPGLSAVTSDPELFKALDGIAFHSYSEGKESGGTASIEARDLILKFKGMKPDAEIWETEFCTTVAENLTDSAIRHLRSMMRDIGYLQANAYFHWLGSGDTEKFRGEELIYNGTKTKLYLVLQRLWNIVVPGSFIVKTFAGKDESVLSAFGPDPMDMLAFVGKGKTIILLTNPTLKTLKLAIKGLAGTSMSLLRTSDNEDMAAVGSQNIDKGEAIVSIPDRSILVLETNKDL
jgi:O-glycosyl hydrolase